MRSLLDILKLGRPHWRGLLIALLLVSLGTTTGLLEPWLYRAVIDDIAGVFVAPPQLEVVEQSVDNLVKQAPRSLQRIFNGPLQTMEPRPKGSRRQMPPRSLHEATATLLTVAILFLLVRFVSEFFRMLGDNRCAREANTVWFGSSSLVRQELFFSF